MKTEDFNLPEFLLSIDDNYNERVFITHKGLSLIEIIQEDLYEATLVFDGKIKKQYEYGIEDYTLVYHTCNVEYFDLKPLEVLDQAWDYFENFLKKEDRQMDEDNLSQLN